ncbi:mycothiol synthase [uncultured Georgenia sp.]|uniref:mycothiol synthase n=1 Tax=uncultured Georgenia sp. TaxID=378209 RepID=UPI002627E754|nr:mycothiol synthase [uncultured Georgenia sp.]HLV05049.1 mycothiol synthase [Actinomycetaceae bacterium]
MAAVSGTGLDAPATPDAVLRLAEQVAAADGVAPLNEQSTLAVRHGTAGYRHHWLAAGDDLVGYAVVDAEGSGELCVHPEHRRRGLGRRLLDAVLAEVPEAALWAHGNLPGAQALARSAGLRVTRELWQMARELRAGATQGPGPAAGEGVSVPGAPEGVGLRPFVVGQDEEAWVGLNALAFADHPEQGRMTVADLQQRQAEPWFDPSLLWLAHDVSDPGVLLASMWVKPAGQDAEIYAVGVAPQAQGRGLGGWLTAVALAEMERRGFRRATLYVEGDNTPAIRTYRRAGFERVALDVQYSR